MRDCLITYGKHGDITIIGDSYEECFLTFIDILEDQHLTICELMRTATYETANNRRRNYVERIITNNNSFFNARYKNHKDNDAFIHEINKDSLKNSLVKADITEELLVEWCKPFDSDIYKETDISRQIYVSSGINIKAYELTNANIHYIDRSKKVKVAAITIEVIAKI